MNIDRYIVTIDDCKKYLIESIEKLLSIENGLAEKIYNDNLYAHLDQLKDSISILVEGPYVDRVYRNSYYSYFSSKLGRYNKDCVRLSFFDGDIDDLEFKDYTKYQELKEKYRGFMVLRPTSPKIIGRSIISPKALKNNHFIICSAKFQTTANFAKFEVEGFPHSS